MKENPKTGLAGKVRELLKARVRAMSPVGICEALNIPRGPDRVAIWDTLKDFQERGEIQKTEKGRFRYNHVHQKVVKGQLKQMVIKAVYVSISGFSASDIQKLSGVRDKHYIQRIMRKLVSGGHIIQISRRKCAHGRGIERVFSIIDRAKFRLDLVG